MKGYASTPNVNDRVKEILSRNYERAENLIRRDEGETFLKSLPVEYRDDVVKLASTRHNGRGIVITLTAYKLALPAQDIRAHKAEHPGGFNARSIDTDTVVPLLREYSLANAGESHWLTQVFSGLPFTADQTLKTQPKTVGEIVPRIVSKINEIDENASEDVLCALLVILIHERNKGQVPMIKQKGLTITRALDLLRAHFNGAFKTGGPRLPQLAVYSIYECLLSESKRYQGHTLIPLERLKTANRKSGTVGDVDVLLGNRTVEAVEIKFGMAVEARHISDAIEKIKSADVLRYYILATNGIEITQKKTIEDQIDSFYRSNGCEIIANGVFETIGYYLRLIGDVDEFIARYVDHLAIDEDVSYEHRIAWNEVCEQAAASGG